MPARHDEGHKREERLGYIAGVVLQPRRVEVALEVVDPDDVEMLEDLIMAAFKNAQEKVKEQSNAALGGLTSGMDLGAMGLAP